MARKIDFISTKLLQILYVPNPSSVITSLWEKSLFDAVYKSIVECFYHASILSKKDFVSRR